MKNTLQNHILSWLTIGLYLYVLNKFFRKNILQIMATDKKVIGEKPQYDINKEAANISTISSGQI